MDKKSSNPLLNDGGFFVAPFGLALPLTYEVHELSTGPSAIVYDARGQAIDTHLFEEQAAGLVLAANAHSAMLAALRLAKAHMEEYLESPFGTCATANALADVNKALALAEVQS